MDTITKTKSFEEKPGVASSSRVGFYWLLGLASVQSLVGSGILAFDPENYIAAGTAWTASLSTVGLAFQMKNNAKKIEEGYQYVPIEKIKPPKEEKQP